MTELLTPSQPITARSFPQQNARSGILGSQVWNRNGKRKNKVHLCIGFMRQNALALCYRGGLEEALNQSNWVDSRSYASKLKLCRSIEEGQTLHGHIIRTGFGSDVNLINKILGMYVRLRRAEDARQLFDEISEKCRDLDYNDWRIRSPRAR